MQHIPRSPGLQQLTATITRLEGELTYANNAATTTFNALDNRQRVLLIGGAPHPDLAAIHSMLLRETEREVVTRIQKDANTFYEGALPDSLAAFDLIVLVGFPGDQSSKQVARSLSASGARLLFVLTEQTSTSMLQSDFGALIPAVPTQQTALYLERTPTITPPGQLHAIFRDLPPLSTRQLPPLLFNTAGWQISPDAQVLAQATSSSGPDIPEPLLVVRSRNGLRTAALLGAGTWRWKNLPENPNVSAEWWPALFDNLLQWLLAPEDSRNVRISPAQQKFDGVEPVQFSGQIYDESLRGVDDATAVLTITDPGGAQYPYTLEGLGNGRYTVDVGILPEGSYTYEAHATRADVTLGTDSGSFTVGTLALEYAETRANVALMRQIANRSGGEHLTPQNIAALGTVLRSDSAFVPLITVETQDRALWQWPLLLALILALLAAEWVLRKRTGLA